MYKSVLIFLAAIVFASSAPVNEDVAPRIIRYEFNNDGNGNYKFSYETSNGLMKEEIGEVVNAGQEDEHILVRGVYSYIGADGSIYNMSYSVDENGHHQSALLRVTLPKPAVLEAPTTALIATKCYDKQVEYDTSYIASVRSTN